jgi:ribonucleoside-diphosphate reductase alpha chain
MAGEFTIVNRYLINDLKKMNLWNQALLDELKYYEGSVQKISHLPQKIKQKYKSAFEIDPIWMTEINALRGKWIDQSISYNIFLNSDEGKVLHDIYFNAWKKGFKTTYYLRTLAASKIESSTLDANKFGYTQMRDKQTIKSCDLSSDCDSCQ